MAAEVERTEISEFDTRIGAECVLRAADQKVGMDAVADHRDSAVVVPGPREGQGCPCAEIETQRRIRRIGYSAVEGV